MTVEDDRFKTYSRRAAILVGGQACLLATLVGRMVYLQVVESDQYEMLAEENRISVRLVAPQRGKILDRFGEALATNRPDYRVLIVPEQINNITQTLAALGRSIPLTDTDFQKVLKSAKRQRAFLPISVKDNLSWDEFARVNVESPELPGVQPDVGSTRHYPYSELAAHLIGYVGAVTDKDLDEENDALLMLPDFKVGKNGVEKSYDLDLRGKAGNTKVEVNALGRVIRELSRDNGTAGEDIHLSVDASIQKFAAERLGEDSGAVVVVDVLTGEIVAMASTPAYDPNQFNVGISHEQWKALLSDPRKPLINKPISGTYPPGSTFKPMVALAALQSGAVTPDYKVHCTGKIAFGNRLFHCWKEHGHGTLDMVGGIEHSCDIYFYDIAQKVGVDGIAEMARRFGLGQISDAGFTGEKPGLIPSTEWKRKTYRQPWHPGETLSVAIGQGYVTTTPLQLAVMAARIANGGKGVKPRLMPASAAEGAAINTALPSLGIAPEWMAVVHEGMTKVTNSPTGTAYAARITDPTLAMAGKSGTSQVRRITMAQRAAGLTKNEDLPWVQRDHALFIAFAPIEAPRYAVSVVLEHGGGGSKYAGPIARDVLLEVMKRRPDHGGLMVTPPPGDTAPDQNPATANPPATTNPQDPNNPDNSSGDDVPAPPDPLPTPVTPSREM